MNKPMSARGGPASGGKNLDSINSQRPERGPGVAIRPNLKPQSVNLLTQRTKSSGKKILKRILAAICLIILVLGGTILLRAANLSQKIFVGQKTTFFGTIANLIRGGGDNQKLIGEDLGQVNILLLGVGGAGHDGPYLTDTMILAQIRPDIGEVTLTSIPRDYLVNLPNNSGQDKINSAFALGLGKNMDWDQAGSWARQVAEHLTGLQIPYFAVIDFSGFEKAVDQVGGLDITVDRTFTDYSFPDNGTGYLPPITFTQGLEHMDGVRALEFARSRHAAGFEGSDFARGVRQQKIITAFKQKVLSLNLIKDTNTLNQLLEIFADHFHTNASPADIYRLYNLLKDKDMNVQSLSLDLDTHLICQEILASNGAYVLTPCPGESETDIQNFFKNSFASAKLKTENATVWLASSTGNQAAFTTALRKLTDAGLNVLQLQYSKDNLPQTTVYQVNPKPATDEFIINQLKATEVTLPPPDVHVTKDKVDLIVVLGTDAATEPTPEPYIAPPARQPSSTSDTVASSTPTSTSTIIKSTKGK